MANIAAGLAVSDAIRRRDRLPSSHCFWPPTFDQRSAVGRVTPEPQNPAAAGFGVLLGFSKLFTYRSRSIVGPLGLLRLHRSVRSRLSGAMEQDQIHQCSGVLGIGMRGPTIANRFLFLRIITVLLAGTTTYSSAGHLHAPFMMIHLGACDQAYPRDSVFASADSFAHRWK